MKSLLIVRHAKSSWGSLALKDFDRPLNDRGLRDAPVMAQRLLNKQITIDAFVASPAKRAFTTASLFAKEYGVKEDAIITFPELYHAPEQVFYNVIEELDDRFDTIALFSHNPGITYFVNGLTEVNVDHMPTCGVFAIRSAAKHWADFREEQRNFWFFDYPKNETGS